MRPLYLLPLWRPRSTLSTPSAFRVEVRPPSLRHAPASLGQRLLFWLLALAMPAMASAGCPGPEMRLLPLIKRCLEDPEIQSKAAHHATQLQQRQPPAAMLEWLERNIQGRR